MNREQNVDVAIIGAGTAGISAFKEASKKTANIVMIDHGPLGTTCARVGCMPSKVLLQTADYFYDRIHFKERGIAGAKHLTINLKKVMQHVRKLRDTFTSGIVKYLESLGEYFIHGTAEFIAPNIIKVDQQKVVAKSIIIAVGSYSIIPKNWEIFRPYLLTSENIFEQKNLHQKIAVIGTGSIGLEFGQALSRLNRDVTAFSHGEFIGKLTDPTVNDHAIKIFQEEFNLQLGSAVEIKQNNHQLVVTNKRSEFNCDQVVSALGKKPSLNGLNLEKLGIKMNDAGIPQYDRITLQVQGLPIFIAGDVDQYRPFLHEAADEGRIAGYNAVRVNKYCFMRRTPLMIIFTQPNIAIVGHAYTELNDKDFVIGEVNFADQGRARIMAKNKGMLRIYADRSNGQLLGAEMAAPQGEHLAHLLAWTIQQKMTVFDALQMPFYHPVVEESLRTALNQAAKKVDIKRKSFDLAFCDSWAAAQLYP